MIASDGGRDGEYGPDRRTQGRRPHHCESGLTYNERRCTDDNANKQRADNASAAMKHQHADVYGNEKRYGICRKPRPTVLSTSPRTSMVVAHARACHHHGGAIWT